MNIGYYIIQEIAEQSTGLLINCNNISINCKTVVIKLNEDNINDINNNQYKCYKCYSSFVHSYLYLCIECIENGYDECNVCNEFTKINFCDQHICIKCIQWKQNQRKKRKKDLEISYNNMSKDLKSFLLIHIENKPINTIESRSKLYEIYNNSLKIKSLIFVKAYDIVLEHCINKIKTDK